MISLPGIYWKLGHFPVKIGLIRVGGPRLYFLMGILLFMLLGSPRKYLVPYDKPFWNIFENSPFSGQNRVNWGEGGSPKFVFHWNPPLFVT